MAIWYRTGTVAVTNGSTTVTGTLTGWLSQVREGDFIFVAANIPVEVATVVSNTQITLTTPWAGSTGSGLSYAVAQGSSWGDVTRLAVQISQLIESNVQILSGSGVPSDSLGTDGSVYFRQDEPEYYAKAAGTWGSPIDLMGPTGATGATGATGNTGPANSLSIGSVTTGAAGSNASASIMGTAPTQVLDLTIPRGNAGTTGAQGAMGPVGPQGVAGASYAATSASSNSIGAGDKVFTTQAGLAYVVGSRARAADASNTANFVEGRVTAYSTTSMTIAVDLIGGSGTITSWNISLAGERGATGATGTTGATGPAGPTYNSTSTTSLAVGIGSKIFTVASGLPYLIGQRLRAASAADPTLWMSGIVADYTTTSLELTVDEIGAAGTADDWNISLTGERGDQGPAGGLGALVAAKGNVVAADGTTFGTLAVGANGSVPVADSTATYGISYQAISAVLAGGYHPTTDVASAATCDIGAAVTDNVNITGTTTITSFGTEPNRLRIVSFAGALTLTYNGTSLILPTSANIVTAAGDTAVFRSDATGKWRCIAYQRLSGLALVGASVAREVLVANRTYYVRTDGSNSNTGLVNNSGGAFLTIQKALDVAASLDLNGYTVTVQVGDGTYTGSTVCSRPFVGGLVIFQGNSGTPGNVIISTTSATCFSAVSGGKLAIRDMELRTTTFGHGLFAGPDGQIDYQNIRFGACATSHMRSTGGKIEATGNYSITGASPCHWEAILNGIILCSSRTLTITGTPAFSTAFAYASIGGMMELFNNTYSGSATGSRYNISVNAGVQTYSNNTSLLPGNAAGSLATGGQYA